MRCEGTSFGNVAQDWRWSSTRTHLSGKDDGMTALVPIRKRVPRFADLLALGPEAAAFVSKIAPSGVTRHLAVIGKAAG